MNSKSTLKSKFRKKGTDELIEPFFKKVPLGLVLSDIVRAHDQWAEISVCVWAWDLKEIWNTMQWLKNGLPEWNLSLQRD